MVTSSNAHHISGITISRQGELQDYLKDVKLQTYPVEERTDGIYINLQ